MEPRLKITKDFVTWVTRWMQRTQFGSDSKNKHKEMTLPEKHFG